jgi:hypothetical protein
MSQQKTISRMGSKVSNLASFFERKPTVQPPKPVVLPKDSTVKGKEPGHFTFNIFKTMEKKQPIQPLSPPPVKLPNSPNDKSDKNVTPSKAVRRSGEKLSPIKAKTVVVEKVMTPDHKQMGDLKKDSPHNDRSAITSDTRKRNTSFKSIQEGFEGISKILQSTAKTDDVIEKLIEKRQHKRESFPAVPEEPYSDPSDNTFGEVKSMEAMPKNLQPQISFSVAKNSLESKVRVVPKKVTNVWLSLLEDTPPTPIVETMSGTITSANIPPLDLVKTYHEKTDLFIGQHEHYIALTNPFWSQEKEPVYTKINRNLFKKVDMNLFEKDLEGRLAKIV